MLDEWIAVGKITKPHGIRGEVRVQSDTDFPEERFSPGGTLYIQPENAEGRPLTVSNFRRQKQFYILKFAGFNHIDEVEPLRNEILYVPKEELKPLPEGEYYYHEILGCRVETNEGDVLGEVADIFKTGANDVWVVRRKGEKDVLIPFIDDIVQSIDVKQGKIVVSLMEGLV